MQNILQGLIALGERRRRALQMLLTLLTAAALAVISVSTGPLANLYYIETWEARRLLIVLVYALLPLGMGYVIFVRGAKGLDFLFLYGALTAALLLRTTTLSQIVPDYAPMRAFVEALSPGRPRRRVAGRGPLRAPRHLSVRLDRQGSDTRAVSVQVRGDRLRLRARVRALRAGGALRRSPPRHVRDARGALQSPDVAHERLLGPMGRFVRAARRALAPRAFAKAQDAVHRAVRARLRRVARSAVSAAASAALAASRPEGLPPGRGASYAARRRPAHGVPFLPAAALEGVGPARLFADSAAQLQNCAPTLYQFVPASNLRYREQYGFLQFVQGIEPAESSKWYTQEAIDRIFQAGVYAAVVVLLGAAAACRRLRRAVSKDQLWQVALMASVFVPMILPGMNPRSFYLASSFSLLYALRYEKRIRVAVLVMGAAFLSYVRP